MKSSTLVLAGSVAVNAVLIALFLSGSPAGTESAAITGPGSHPAATAPVAHDPNTLEAVDPATWTNLGPGDLAGMLARLRAEGFPPAIVRAIMAEQVRVQFAPRRHALGLNETQRPFWEPATSDAKTEAARRQILKEQDQALKDLLGPDADDPALANLHRQFPGLSDDKVAAIQRAQQALSEKEQAILTSGSINIADITALEKERHAEIAKILAPQELEDYDLRTSTTANTLRRQLATFNPTEQEFRALYQLQKPYDDQFQLMAIGTMAPDQQQQLLRQRMTAQTQLNNDIQAALGEARYAEYQRSIDGNYQQTTRLVARLELPPETADQVYTVQQDMQQRLRAVQTDRTLAPDDRNAQLAALNAEAQSRVTAALGQRGYEAYKQYGGNWLQQLQPRPVPVTRKATGGGGGAR